ncbi:MAG: cytochrome c oxidase subunit 3 [Planctomycetes bacterium]|nr:cytochrome c oxidase subunit 3 [Planctomycetota bacterium]
MKLQMPPKGGNPMLKDPALHDIVAYIRKLEIKEVSIPSSEGNPEVTPVLPKEIVAINPDHKDETPQSFLDDIPLSTLPHANIGPTGLAPESDSDAQRLAVLKRSKVPQLDETRPANAHLFFGLYFLMTGLHGIHVVVGIFIMLWLMYRLQRGDFTRHHYTAVECSGLYWHIVDVIWIFLFPLWYLIA